VGLDDCAVMLNVLCLCIISSGGVWVPRLTARGPGILAGTSCQ